MLMIISLFFLKNSVTVAVGEEKKTLLKPVKMFAVI